MPNIPVILCADDYALTHSVNRGILSLVKSCRLSAVSCLTTRPSWAEGASELFAQQRVAERAVSIGLHLNLTLGSPLGPMPRLVADSELPSLHLLISKAFLRMLDQKEISAEINRQIDAFIEQSGRAPDFIDGHQHVHVLPTVRSALFQVLKSRGLTGKLWLRNPSDWIISVVRRGISTRKTMIISALGMWFGRQAKMRGFQINQGFSGVSSFDPSSDFAFNMQRFLISPGPSHLIICHPGEIDNELCGLEANAAFSRQAELAYLASEKFLTFMKAKKILLKPRP